MCQSTPFAGTAQQLVRHGLSSVIAMQFSISDQAAIILAKEFYCALADGYPVDAALAEARIAIFAQSDSTSRTSRGAEWAVPILFMRAPHGRLFDMADLYDDDESERDDSPAPGDPPYQGLHYFSEKEAYRFFGREKLTAELVAHLRYVGFLAVVGASGSGKSSLVRAGLVPALSGDEVLEDGTFPPEESQHWAVHIITPTNHPLEALAASLTRDVESVTATGTLMDDLAQDARSLHLYVRKLLSQNSEATRLLLVVDQFEELFTLCRDKTKRKAFVDNLLTASERGPTIVVITLRADFYTHCSQFENLRHALETKQKYIGAMTTEELRSAIEKPAQQGEWEFEEGLVDLLLEDVGEEPGALPLLSHALLETWQRRRGRLLTFAGYREAGGIKGAIARTADRVFYQHLNEEQQKIARSLFLRLTELGEGAQDTRRRVSFTELIESSQSGPVETVIKLLADKRLITTDASNLSNPLGPEGAAKGQQEENQHLVHVEVAHEALIREWPTLREWLDEDREGLRIHRDLTEAALKWQKLKRDPGALYRGTRLAQTLEWATDHLTSLNTLERRFLGDSKELVEREKQERQAQQKRELEAAQKLAQAQQEQVTIQRQANKRLQKRNRLITAVGIIALVAAVLASFFWWDANNERNNVQMASTQVAQQRDLAEQQKQEAERQARIATARQLAAQAQSALDKYPQRSLLLALEALNVTMREKERRVPAAEQALRDALANTGGIGLSGHEDAIRAVSISPDNHWLVTGSWDKTARLWDLTQQEPQAEGVILRGHSAWISAVSISPDNHQTHPTQCVGCVWCGGSCLSCSCVKLSRW